MAWDGQMFGGKFGRGEKGGNYNLCVLYLITFAVAMPPSRLGCGNVVRGLVLTGDFMA